MMEFLSDVRILPTLVFVIVTTFTPGPNNILSGSMGALFGYRRTLPFLLGVTSGFLIIMVICATLSSAMSTFLPTVTPYVRVIGALYILWLAYSVYRSSNVLDQPGKAEPLGITNGFILQFVNPKAAFFGLTLFSTFLAPIAGKTVSILTILPVLMGVTFSAVSTWAVGGQVIRRWLSTPRRMRAFGIVLAAALVYTALDLLGLFLR